MPRIRPWLLVVIIVVGVGVYFALVSLGPKPEPARDRAERPRVRETSAPDEPEADVWEEETGPAGEAGADIPEPVRAYLDGCVEVSGRVLSLEGRPLAGAAVRCSYEEEALDEEDSFDGTVRRTDICMTDKAGRFTYSGLPPGTHCLSAEHSEYVPSKSNSVEIEADHAVRGIEIRLARGGFVSGTVTDEHGAPVEEAVVRFVMRAQSEDEELGQIVWRARAETDASGDYRSSVLVPGAYTVRAEHGHLLPSEEHTVKVAAAETVTDVNLVLGVGVAISGWVVDWDGNPVPGATVSAGWVRRGELKTVADQAGAFFLHSFEPGRYEIGVSAPGFCELTKAYSAPAEGVVIRLRPVARIKGRVVDKLTQQPVEVFSVQWDDYGGGFAFAPGREEHPGGRFELVVTKPGERTVTVDAPGYATATVEGIETREGVDTDEILVELVRGATLTFHVTSAKDGHNVEEAVLYKEGSPRYPGLWSHVGTTENGMCSTKHTLPGRHSFVVRHPEFVTKQFDVYVASGEEEKTVEIALDKAPVIRGRVVDKLTQRPVKAFSVALDGFLPSGGFGPPSYEVVETSEHPQGRFELTAAEPGEHTVCVYAEGYAVTTVEGVETVLGRETEEVLVELVRGATLTFHVTSAEDGRPIEGATVYPPSFVERRERDELGGWGEEFGGGFDEPEAVTDANGTYTIEHVSPGRHEFEVSRCDLTPPEFSTKRVVVDIEDEDRERVVEVVLAAEVDPDFEKLLAVRGRVVSKTDGTPIAAAKVQLYDAGALPRFDRPRWSTETDQEGAFILEDVMPGEHLLLVRHPQYAPFEETTHFDEGRDAELLVEMTDCGRIVGTVTTSDGAPAPHAMVEINAPYTFADKLRGQPDPDGDYVIAAVGPGTHELVARNDSYSLRKRVTVHSGRDTRADIVFGGAAVFGAVTLRGRPVRGIELHAKPREGSSAASGEGSFSSSKTDEQGCYRLEGLGPGSYTLRLELADEGYDNRVTRDVRVHDQDVRFDIELGGGNISGTVYDEHGWPVVGASIMPIPEPAGGDRTADIFGVWDVSPGSYRTADDGTFCIRAVPPGSYRLVVGKDGFARQLLVTHKQAEGDVAGLKITLIKEATVVVRPRGEDEQVPEYVFVGICDEQGRAIHGQFASALGSGPTSRYLVHGLGSGRFTLFAWAKGYALLRREVTIAAGEETQVDLNFKKGPRLDVTVLDGLGAPVPNAQVVLDPGGDVSLAAQVGGLGTTGEDGRVTQPHTADGEYTLRVRCEGYEDAAVPVRVAGRDAQVTVTLRARED